VLIIVVGVPKFAELLNKCCGEAEDDVCICGEDWDEMV
jgi:hypothetical protein